jgi:hypothetical protein
MGSVSLLRLLSINLLKAGIDCFLLSNKFFATKEMQSLKKSNHTRYDRIALVDRDKQDRGRKGAIRLRPNKDSHPCLSEVQPATLL